MKKARLVKCSARFTDRRGFPRKCNSKAVVFPITEHGNLSKKHYCNLHWPKFEKYYDNFIKKKNGCLVGELNKLLLTAKDDENCEIMYDIHSPISSTQGPRDFTEPVSYTSNHTYPKLSLWKKIKKTFKKIFGG